MNAVPISPVQSITIRPWFDVVIDELGHDPRSLYVETYWLSVLGPTTTWLLRRIATALDDNPGGFELDLADTARSMGLGERCGRHSPFTRAFTRLVQFDLAQPQGDPVLAVRRKIPPLTRRQLQRLPEALQASHQELLDAALRTPDVEHLRRRARQLLRWKFHPALAREAAAWAWERHCHTVEPIAPVLEVAPGGDAA